MGILAEDNITLTSQKTVNDKAEAAKTLAEDTAQYFWITETGTDTGAHITEIPREDFEADPVNGGGNLLARSNGIAVRNGLTESAVFGGDLVRIGQSDKCHMEITPRSMYFRDYTGKYLITVNVSNDQSTGLATVTYNYICDNTTTVYTAFVINEILECYNADTSDPIAVTKTGDLEVTYDNPQQIGTHIILTYTTYDFVYNIGLGTRTNGEAFGADSVVIGNNNAATNYLGIAIGARNKVDGRQAIAIGRHLIAKSYQQLVLGRFNVEDTNGDYELIVGNGTADNARNNALAIAWNGDLYLKGQKLVDYVIEEGTGGSSYWKYRKWSSGRIEAWYSRSIGTQYSFNTRGSSSSYYWTNSNWISYNVALPSGLFTNISNVSLNVGSNGYLNQCVPSYTTSNIVVRLWTNYSANPTIYTVSLYVVGE